MSAFFGITERITQLECPAFRRRLASVYRDLGFDGFSIDLCAVARRIGLEVRVNPRFPAAGQIWTLRNGQRVIGLRNRPLHGRAKFTFAHELAHEMVRQDWLGLVPANSRRFDMEEVEEPFCDFVAGLLLMPLPSFFPRVSEMAHRFPNVNQWDYKRLADDFRVSVSCVVIQITMLKSFHFLYEAYDYGPIAPEIERIRLQPSNRCLFSGRWNYLGGLMRHTRAENSSDFTTIISDEVVEKTARIMSGVNSPNRQCAKIAPVHQEPRTDWGKGGDVIVLERTGTFSHLRHLLRPAK